MHELYFNPWVSIANHACSSNVILKLVVQKAKQKLKRGSILQETYLVYIFNMVRVLLRFVVHTVKKQKKQHISDGKKVILIYFGN